MSVGSEPRLSQPANISVDVGLGLPQWSRVVIQNPNNFGLARGVPKTGVILGKIMPSFIPVTVNYHFMGFGSFQPYVGIGAAPVFSFQTHDGYQKGLSVAPTIGLVLAAGADMMIDRHWGIAFDVKKVFASVTTTSNGIAAAPGAVANSKLTTFFQPWVLSTGVTYRF